MRTEAGTMDPKDVRELEQLLLMRKPPCSFAVTVEHDGEMIKKVVSEQHKLPIHNALVAFIEGGEE